MSEVEVDQQIQCDNTASADAAQSETLHSTVGTDDTINDQEEQSPSGMDDSWVVIDEPASGHEETLVKNAEGMVTSEEGSNLSVDAVVCAPSSSDQLPLLQDHTAMESLEQVVMEEISSAEQQEVSVSTSQSVDEQQTQTEYINELVPTSMEEASVDSTSDPVNEQSVDEMEVIVCADSVEDVSNDQEQGLNTVYDREGLELPVSCSFEFIQADSTADVNKDDLNKDDHENNSGEGVSACETSPVVSEEERRAQVTSTISAPTLTETPQIDVGVLTVEVSPEEATADILTSTLSENSEISSDQTPSQSSVILTEPSTTVVSMDDVQDVSSVGNGDANKNHTIVEPMSSTMSVDNQAGETDSSAAHKDTEIIPVLDDNDIETIDISSQEAGVLAVSLDKSQDTEEDESSNHEVADVVECGDSGVESRAKELLAEVERKRLENQQKRDAVKGPRYVVYNSIVDSC